ncbi:MAG: UDP-N-acetylglucosamine 2-epimerase (non-hydrolyzing) [Methanomassiliicoccales archaeon]|jgi:UDP-N-acetylglucosamine 2-epimerase|nr:UDP-N-acetylglucosamine 2-epimerase (non-hydrolyzing) [Methanomassiliicoccales archaeon]
MKIASIIGARPQFIKIAPLKDEISKRHEHLLIHTGQHYDYEMSKVFFEELNIPDPDYHLGIGSGSHANQTGRMLMAIEDVLLKEKPELVIVYGDTNSTLAGALASAKLLIPVAHVEAGLRSFNMKMPEEVNRVVTDHISSIFLCPSDTAAQNLAREGIVERVHVVGDTMIQCLMDVEQKLSKSFLQNFGVTENDYILATIHRQENADVKERLVAILRALSKCGMKVLLPLHPRTAKNIRLWGLEDLIASSGNVKILPPLNFITFTSLEKYARKVVTDSGGVQKEAYYFGVPCITVREETEWVETVRDGWNVLVGADEEKILHAIHSAKPKTSRITNYGDRNVAQRIVESLEKDVQGLC